MRFKNFTFTIFIFLFFNINGWGENYFQIKDKRATFLLDQAVKFFDDHTVSECAHEFVKSDWQLGDIFIFLIDAEGACYAFGWEKNRIWSDFSKFKDLTGRTLIDRFLKRHDDSISFFINNSVLYSRLKKVKKGEKVYVLGAAFYPKDPLFNSVGLVKSAIELMDEIGVQQSLSIISDPNGYLVRSGVYVDVLDSKGWILAHGGERSRVGQNIYNTNEPRVTAITKYKDKILKRFAKEKDESIWFSRKVDGLEERLYVEKYVDKSDGKVYFIGSIANPDINEQVIYELVQRAIKFLQNAKTLDKAFQMITEKKKGFRIGQAIISVYSPDGLCLANGENPSFVGQNRKNYQDAMGDYPVKEIVDSVKDKDSAWIMNYEKHGNKLIYVEKIKLIEQTLIVTAGFWPLLPKCVQSMTERAVDILKNKSFTEAFKLFSDGSYEFFQGDIFPLIFNDQGTILVNGPYRKGIWHSLNKADKMMQKIIKNLIKNSTNEGTWLKINHAHPVFSKKLSGLDSVIKLYAKNVEIVFPDKSKAKLIVATSFYE